MLVLFIEKILKEGEERWNNSSAQKQRNTKDVVFKSVVCIMLPVLSDIYKTWNSFFLFYFSWMSFLYFEFWSRSCALSCPVGWHSALGRLHRHSFQPAALWDRYKNQWCRTGSLPEYQKSFYVNVLGKMSRWRWWQWRCLKKRK